MSGPTRLDIQVAASAEAVLTRIIELNDGALSDEMRRRLLGLPAMLRTSGAPATLAFLASRSGSVKPLEKAYAAVDGALRELLAAELGWPAQPPRLYGAMREADSVDLARAFLRLEAFAGWLRRLAEAAARDQNAARETKEAGHGLASGSAGPGGPVRGGASSDG